MVVSAHEHSLSTVVPEAIRTASQRSCFDFLPSVSMRDTACIPDGPVHWLWNVDCRQMPDVLLTDVFDHAFASREYLGPIVSSVRTSAPSSRNQVAESSCG